MAADAARNRLKAINPAIQRTETSEQLLTLSAEKLEVSLRRVETALVRATSTTRSREQIVEEQLSHQRVEVERIAIGRTVDSVPPVRQDGDTTVLSVVQEVIVVERRLVLKEEVHIRRVKTSEHHREMVSLREQEATVTRTMLEPNSLADASAFNGLSSNSPSNKDHTR